MNSAAEWVASIPAQLTARDALVFIDTALGDAKQAADEIAARFQGTVMPPPWPMHAELQRAYGALEGGRKMLVTIIDQLGHGDTVRDKTDPQVVRLLNAGKILYREIAVMQEKMRGVKVEDVPRLVLDAAKRVAENKIGGWLFMVGLLWALREFGDD